MLRRSAAPRASPTEAFIGRQALCGSWQGPRRQCQQCQVNASASVSVSVSVSLSVSDGAEGSP